MISLSIYRGSVKQGLPLIIRARFKTLTGPRHVG